MQHKQPDQLELNMKYQDHQLLEEAYDAVLIKEHTEMPIDWDKGFDYPYRIGCNGTETPYTKNGKWFLYVYNVKDKQHYVYSYSDDRYYPADQD